MAKKEKKTSVKKKGKGLWNDFKAFISKGSVLDLAVGVVIGGAFSAIVTATVNVLLSVCTWAVPGGLKGLVTVLPAINDAQRGVEGIGQAFGTSQLTEMVLKYAQSKGIVISTASDYASVEAALLKQYTQYGNSYFYNGSALINWGAIINAVISFLIIALVLFIIVKAYATIKTKKAELDAKLLEEHYKKHPEDRPAPVDPELPKPTEAELLTQIRDLLKEKQESK